MKLTFVFFFLLITINSSAQQSFTNKKGNYKITAPEKWKVEQNGETISVYAPDEGEMDTWQEKLEVSLTDANDLNLEEAFAFYIEQDFPSVYSGLKIEEQGNEIINGEMAKWAVISFTGSGTVGTSEVSFTLYNLFYLFHRNGKLYMLNGIAEKGYFPKLENHFREIARSFQFTK